MVSVMLLRIVLYAPILGIGGVIKVASTHTGMGWIIGVAVGILLLLIGVLVTIAMPKFRKMQDLMDRVNLVSGRFLPACPWSARSTGRSSGEAFRGERRQPHENAAVHEPHQWRS
jgi:ATP-binding cassette subfamily B protein